MTLNMPSNFFVRGKAETRRLLKIGCGKNVRGVNDTKKCGRKGGNSRNGFSRWLSMR